MARKPRLVTCARAGVTSGGEDKGIASSLLNSTSGQSSSLDGGWFPSSEEERLLIRHELQEITASPSFRNSQRYPAFLGYVVEKKLVGDVAALKERTLGVEVFHRSPDYDTNADPVVRFCAGEVRRRLAQFYREKATLGSVEISLPVGSYVPVFLRREQPAAVVERSSPESGELEASPFGPVSEETASLPLESPQVVSLSEASTARSSPSLRTFALALTLVCLFAVAVVGLSLYWRDNGPVSDVWAPFLRDPNTVMISTGRTHLDDVEQHESATTTIGEHILRPEARISFASVQAIGQIAGILHAHNKRFRLSEAYSTNLPELHGVPVVLVSGYNNLWTMRLLAPLRFRFMQENSFHYIQDAEHLDRRSWNVDFSKPYLQQTADYAIVARFYDATTGGPVVIVAGIGSNGTDAAGDFIVSARDLAGLARLAPGGTLTKNFEAVLKVEVVGGNTGAVSVIASDFW